MAEIHGVASFPGVVGAISCSYVASHGISPGVATLIMQPQDRLPQGFGDLRITDANTTVVLTGCKIDRIYSVTNASGTEWRLDIADRRWRWRDFGSISGAYNQLDPNGKLIAWTIRSPTELALMCFNRVGEIPGGIDLPNGLDSSVGRNINSLLIPGQQFPPTGTNPPVVWTNEPPMAALQRICDQYGRHIVFNPATNLTSIEVIGIGAGLPDGSYASFSPSLKVPDLPSAVAVVGDPTKYQFRVDMQAVSEEWNGVLKPILQLSYAPVFPAAVAKVNIDFNTGTPTPPATTNPNTVFEIRLSYTDPKGRISSYQYQHTLGATEDSTAVADAFEAEINASGARTFVKAVSLTNQLRLIAKEGFWDFSYSARITTPAVLNNRDATVEIRKLQDGHAGGPTWAFSPPPLFPGVRATDRLTLPQAQALAQKHVWKTYQISGLDISGIGPIQVPGFGKLLRRQQLVMLDSKVDQIVPEEADRTFTDRLGRPLIVNYYDGLSRDKPAVCYGAVAQWLINGVWLAGGQVANNTPEKSLILIPFGIDPVYQTIAFSNYAYKLGDTGKITEPDIVLETGFNVLDPETNAPICFSTELPLGGNAPIFVEKKPDVQLNITTTYDSEHRLLRTDIAEADAILRATYYLQGMAIQYKLESSGDITYNGLMGINLNGLIQQVTWSVGPEGVTTQASANSEHAINVPPYPARRRIENLRPRQVRRLEGGDGQNGMLQQIRSGTKP